MAKQSFNDFSGGITDFPFNTASNYAEIMDNWVPLRDKTMEVRHGFGLAHPQYSRTPYATRTSEIINLDDTRLYVSNGDILYIDSNDIMSVSTPNISSGKVFNNADEFTMVDHAKWGQQYFFTDDDYSFPIKLFKDDNNEYRIVNAGLPKPADGTTLGKINSGTNSVIYAIVYEYYYRVGTTLFLDLGEPFYIATDEGSDFELPASVNVLDNMPVLTNGGGRNYDLTAVRKRIYRTVTDGTTFYLVDTVDNDVTRYDDGFEDSEITSNEVLYTQGGILPNHMPPQAKYITICNNVAWYGNVLEGAETKPYRLRFSKVADLDSCPDTFFEDFEGDITGLSLIEDMVIVFTDKATLRLQGVLDDIGRGSISRDTIADVPCVSSGSIVKAQDYIYWFGDSGIHRTNGIQQEKLTRHLDTSYQKWISSDFKKRHVKGAYDPINKRIKWCINESSSDNDKILVYDEVLGGFYTESSGVDYSPSAILFEGEKMHRADADGYLFVHSPDIYSDMVKDPSFSVGNWTKKAIPYEWKHVAWDMGDSENVKWTTKVNVSGRPKSNVYLEPRSYREGSIDYYKMSTVKFNPLMKWGDPTLLWGDFANKWNSVDYMNQTKRVHRKAKRVTHLQLSLASGRVKILSSSNNEASYAAVNSSNRTITLLNPDTYKFSIDSKGHEIEIEGKLYEITSSSESALVVADPSGTLPDGNYAWTVIGAPKNQRPHISNLSVHFEVMGDDDKMTGSSGEAA